MRKSPLSILAGSQQVLNGIRVNIETDAAPALDAATPEHLTSIGYLQGVEEQPAPETEKPQVKDPVPDDGPTT